MILGQEPSIIYRYVIASPVRRLRLRSCQMISPFKMQPPTGDPGSNN